MKKLVTTDDNQNKISNTESKDGKCLTKISEILDRWTEYCTEFYNYQISGDKRVLGTQTTSKPIQASAPITRSEVEEAMKALKYGKSAGVDNIPAELFRLVRK